MTYEEAIKWLGKQPHHFSTIEEAELDQECRAIINEALEKQIPKKPKSTLGKGWPYECECGGYIEIKDKYCSNCGQAIDWSDDEWLN